MGRAPAWTEREIEILRTTYVREGLEAAHKLLPGRNPQAIYVKASKDGLRTEHRPCPRGKFRELVEPVMRLRAQGWSDAAIGSELGVCEATAANARLLGECIAGGHRPVERDHNGKIIESGRERMRLMFRRGMKHRDIQVHLGVAAATLTRERRLYEQYLKEKGKAPLPPIGGGERYSGAAIPRELKRKVEELYLEGFGAGKVSAATGVSRTHCLRIRTKLIKRLKRKKECLPGCDLNGRRNAYKDHRRRVPQQSLEKLKQLILSGETVARAARLSFVGGSTAYKVYHQLKAALEGEGKDLPRNSWRGRQRQAAQKLGHRELPGGRWGYDRYRALIHSGQPQVLAFDQVRREWSEKSPSERNKLGRRSEANASQPTYRTLEEQIALIEKGRVSVVEVPSLPRAQLGFTAGRIAGAAL